LKVAFTACAVGLWLDDEVDGRPRIYLSSPHVTDLERAALLAAFDAGWIAPVGPDLDRFETALHDLTGWHAVALSSGTAALHLALLEAGVQAGDHVAVSSFTFAASANAVVMCGAQPVFVDSEADTWNMSPALLAQAIETGRADGHPVRAAVVVDLYGQCADYDALVPLCADAGVTLIEDAAEALAATRNGRPAGTFGRSGVLSFNGNKIITTSGGGAFLTPDVDAAARVRYLATQARQPVVHYEHTEVGFNYRLSNLLAALGTAQLSRLAEMSARRLAINAGYRELLADQPLTFMPVPAANAWNGWLTCVVFESPAVRDAVLAAVTADDVEARPLWKPLHLQPVFAGCPAYVDGTSADLFARGLCLPSGSVLSDADVARVGDLVRSACAAAQ
jgi:dTDP-4-amino-4,6-dideoxygalactose transaminase